jgi:hypothetical protein
MEPCSKTPSWLKQESIRDNFIFPTIGATGALAVTCLGFLRKTALQTDRTPVQLEFLAKLFKQTDFIPISFKQLAKQTFKIAPPVGLMVGCQIFLDYVYKNIRFGDDKKMNLLQIGESALVSSSIMSFPYVIFNELTRGLSFGQAVKASLSNRKFLMLNMAFVTFRETLFVGPLAASGFAKEKIYPYTENMKPILAFSVFSAITFTFAGAGSLIGHSSDTAMSLIQDGKVAKMNPFFKFLFGGASMKGGLNKGLAIALFSTVLSAEMLAFNLLVKKTKESSNKNA